MSRGALKDEGDDDRDPNLSVFFKSQVLVVRAEADSALVLVDARGGATHSKPSA